MTAKRMKMTGRVINTAAMISPRTAGRIAFNVFTRTRDAAPATAKERALFEQALPRMAEAQRETLQVAGYAVAVHRFPPIGQANGRRLLFTHGWGSRIAFAQGLITGLRQAGYEVCGIDLPGHGESSGASLHAGAAIATIGAVARAFGPFDAMIGHSFGGFMTVLAAHGALGGGSIAPDRIVLIASPGDVRRVLKGFSHVMGFNARVRQALAGELERATGRPLDAAFAPGYLRASGIPTLVLHAPEDKEVGADAARLYAEAGPHVTVAWLDGLGHRRIVNSPEAIEAITKFLES